MALRATAHSLSRQSTVINFQIRQLTTTSKSVALLQDSERRAARPWARRTQQLRWHSTSAAFSKVYEFTDVKALSEKPSQDRKLIDVREPSEYAAGTIPNSVNVPISSHPDALMIPPEEFEDRFGIDKPGTSKEVVFFCKAGVRSSAAAKLASQSGYDKVGEYRGSWLDWTSNGGQVQKSN